MQREMMGARGNAAADGRRQVRGLLITGLASLAALVGIVVAVGPESIWARIGLFAILYAGLVAWLSLAAYALSFRLFSRRRYRGDMTRALQHGAVAATICLVAALLQVARALSPLALALLAGVLGVGEIVVLLRR